MRLERSSRETGVAGRTNLTLWLVVKGEGKEEGETWRCCSDVGADTSGVAGLYGRTNLHFWMLAQKVKKRGMPLGT